MNAIEQAMELVDNNQIEKALKLLKEHLSIANDDEKFTIAELYLNWGLLEDAEEILLELINNYPDENELKMSLIDIYIESERDDQALHYLTQVDQESPEYGQALLQMADLYQSQGLFEVAEQKLLEAKQLLPNEVVIDFALGELFFSIGEYIKALTHYEKVIKENEEMSDVSIRDRLAETYAAVGEYEKALEYYKEDEDGSPDTFFKYGFTARQAERNDIAIKAWKHLLDLDPYYHSVYLHLAQTLEDEGMKEEAFDTAKQGLQVDEFNKELYMLSGNLAHQFGQDAQGEEYIRQAIALDPDYKEAILFLIEFLKEKERHSEIIELIFEIEKIGSMDALYDWELARAYNEEEQFDKAYESYQKAYMNLRDDTDFLKEYGYFLTEDGRTKDAIIIFKSYLDYNPEDYVIEEFISRLSAGDEL